MGEEGVVGREQSSGGVEEGEGENNVGRGGGGRERTELGGGG